MSTSLNLGPLTTLFTPPSKCTAEYYRYTEGSKFYDGVGPSPSPTECYPSKWTSDPDYFYSPGLCPNGYTNAMTMTTGAETRATCCPVGYSFAPAGGVFWSSILPCAQAVNTSLSIVAYSDNTTPIMTTPAQINTWWAYSVQVRYQASDSAVLGGAIVGATGDSSHGLSIGAAIGIGFGSAIAAMLLLGGVLLLCFSKRRKRTAREASAAAKKSEAQNSEKRQDVVSWQTTDSNQTHPNYPPMSIMTMDQAGQYMPVPVELATSGQRSELSVSTPMELPTNISHHQHDSQTSIPFSSPSPSQTHTSQGHVSQSPNFFQQQQQFSQ